MQYELRRLLCSSYTLWINHCRWHSREPVLEYAVAMAEGSIHHMGDVVLHVNGFTKELTKDINSWVSKGGLVYGPDKKFGSRINHVLQHTVPNINKLNHTVFTLTGEALFDLIDFAWSKRGLPLSSDPGTFIIELDRIVGTLGERAIKIVTVPGTSNIITAYPIKV